MGELPLTKRILNIYVPSLLTKRVHMKETREPIDPEQIDYEKIADLFIILFFLVCFSYIAYLAVYNTHRASFVEYCKTNPVEKNGQACNDPIDCIKKCGDRLYRQSLEVKKTQDNTKENNTGD